MTDNTMSEEQVTDQGRSRTVWVYDDPASGIEISDRPGMGRAVVVPVDLLERFDAARQAFDEVADEVSDLLNAVKSADASPSCCKHDADRHGTEAGGCIECRCRVIVKVSDAARNQP